MRHWLFLTTITVALVSVTTNAGADEPDRNTCHAAYEQGQRLRRGKKLVEARERFMLCARDPCPRAFQPECAKWLGEISAELPTIVIDVRRRGELVSDAKVMLDGAPYLESVDGVARSIDPGPHEFRVTLPSGATVARRETVVEGAKAQRFTFDFEAVLPTTSPAMAPPLETRRGPPSPIAIGLTALGVAALGSFGYFGVTGLSQRSDIEACDPNCRKRDVDDAQRTMLVADISLGVAVVALGGALVLYLTQPRVPVTHAAAARRGDF